MPSTIEVHNGPVEPAQLIEFQIEKTGIVLVSNQNGDAQTFSLELLSTRRNMPEQASDYATVRPLIPFDNDNNYQVLTTGFYALRVLTANNIIVVITE